MKCYKYLEYWASTSKVFGDGGCVVQFFKAGRVVVDVLDVDGQRDFRVKRLWQPPVLSPDDQVHRPHAVLRIARQLFKVNRRRRAHSSHHLVNGEVFHRVSSHYAVENFSVRRAYIETVGEYFFMSLYCDAFLYTIEIIVECFEEERRVEVLLVLH
jgi:hypothetical protein